jgi:hypothetical protein
MSISFLGLMIQILPAKMIHHQDNLSLLGLIENSNNLSMKGTEAI